MGIPQETERETGKNFQVAGWPVVVGDLLLPLIVAEACAKRESN